MSAREARFRTAEVVLPCPDLDESLAFFVDGLQFRLDAIFPADDPSVAVISGHGLKMRLQRGGAGAPGALRLSCEDPSALADGATELVAPNGTRVCLALADAPLEVPELQPSLVVSLAEDDSAWAVGRAGMRYRDLIPGRQGGRFIASHIRIAEGGPVPDYVHFHEVRFQLIYCYRGWVKVVYEDQGPPFVLNAGDCVLQPPTIRHRVLESSSGLEVIEVGCPAEHATRVDHELDLPTSAAHPERQFADQRFVRHVASDAQWMSGRHAGFEVRDLGIGSATNGLAGARVVRGTSGASATAEQHDAELAFTFVLDGEVALECAGRDPERLGAGAAFAVPAGLEHTITGGPHAFELLEVTLSAEPLRR